MKRALLLLVACTASPKPPELTREQKAAFAAIDRKAASVANLDIDVDGYAGKPGPSTDLEAALDALAKGQDVLAPMRKWVDAHGRLPDALEDPGAEIARALRMHELVEALAKNPPLDDERVQILLFLETRLRRDGRSLVEIMVGFDVPPALLDRPPPPLANYYVPKDADVVRGFLVDTQFSRRMYARQKPTKFPEVEANMITAINADAIATQVLLADAPWDRNEFLRYITAIADGHPSAKLWSAVASRMFALEDQLRAWATQPVSSTTPPQ